MTYLSGMRRLESVKQEVVLTGLQATKPFMMTSPNLSRVYSCHRKSIKIRGTKLASVSGMRSSRIAHMLQGSPKKGGYRRVPLSPNN